jgi:CRISPR/Cas system-associated protein Cas5 (RAMP superfamily)
MATASGGGATRGLSFLSPLATALIGAVVGGLGGAYLGVTIGADRDDARADREFAREQRIEVYGEFLGNIDKAMGSIEPGSTVEVVM